MDLYSLTSSVYWGQVFTDLTDVSFELGARASQFATQGWGYFSPPSSPSSETEEEESVELPKLPLKPGNKVERGGKEEEE